MADIDVGINEAVPDSPSSGPDLEKQQSLEKSTTTTSHHHDSEYDTASDLEGGEEDYDDENDDESVDDEDKDDDLEEGTGSETGSEYEEEDEERQRGDGQEQIDSSKKVDEDRSNPQYIPKKGTFYEHDDRTVDEPEVIEISKSGAEGPGESAPKGVTPQISSASKTMKKWQPASAVERWSHDRYDENEQAPKSRAELVSAYGYDIRSEDGPPRARRRRRYGRGPSKYNRSWEDETAYIKSKNPRRPPKAEEFPALNERRTRRSSRKYRDEKENRFDKSSEGRVSKRDNYNRSDKRGGNKTYKSGGTGGTHTNSIRRTTDFKNKNRTTTDDRNKFENNRHPDYNNYRNQTTSQGNRIFDEQKIKQVETVSFTNKKINSNNTNVGNSALINQRQLQQQQLSQSPMHNHNDRYNNGYTDNSINYSSQSHLTSVGNNSFSTREIKEKLNQVHIGNQVQANSQILSQSMQNKPSNLQVSQLQTRLQQVQNRNDPSHVGSVQMHTLANQQPPIHQTSPNPSMNPTIISTDIGSQSESGRPKRYSSLRQRNQNDQNVMQQMVSPSSAGLSNPASHQQIESHNLPQMHLQHDHVAVAAAHQQQALLQANLMQLYKDNLQAQQVGVSAIPNINQTKPPSTTNVPPSAQFSGIVHNSQFNPSTAAGSAAAYYSPGPNEYTVGPPNVPGTAPQPPYAIPFGPQTQPPPNVQQPPPQQPTQSNSLPPNTPGTYPNFPPPNAPTQYTPSVTPGQQFNTVGGTTYFVPHTQPTQRQTSLPQRRPTNPIPILPPSDKNKSNISQIGNSVNSEKENNSITVSSVENIDHILDNMFVQRQPFQPAIQPSSSQTSIISNASTTASTNSSQSNIQKQSESRIDEAIKNLTISDVDSTTTKSNDREVENSTSENKQVDNVNNTSSEPSSSDAKEPK